MDLGENRSCHLGSTRRASLSYSRASSATNVRDPQLCCVRMRCTRESSLGPCAKGNSPLQVSAQEPSPDKPKWPKATEAATLAVLACCATMTRLPYPRLGCGCAIMQPGRGGPGAARVPVRPRSLPSAGAKATAAQRHAAAAVPLQRAHATAPLGFDPQRLRGAAQAQPRTQACAPSSRPRAPTRQAAAPGTRGGSRSVGRSKARSGRNAPVSAPAATGHPRGAPGPLPSADTGPDAQIARTRTWPDASADTETDAGAHSYPNTGTNIGADTGTDAGTDIGADTGTANVETCPDPKSDASASAPEAGPVLGPAIELQPGAVEQRPCRLSTMRRAGARDGSFVGRTARQPVVCRSGGRASGRWAPRQDQWTRWRLDLSSSKLRQQGSNVATGRRRNRNPCETTSCATRFGLRSVKRSRRAAPRRAYNLGALDAPLRSAASPLCAARCGVSSAMCAQRARRAGVNPPEPSVCACARSRTYDPRTRRRKCEVPSERRARRSSKGTKPPAVRAAVQSGQSCEAGAMRCPTRARGTLERRPKWRRRSGPRAERPLSRARLAPLPKEISRRAHSPHRVPHCHTASPLSVHRSGA